MRCWKFILVVLAAVTVAAVGYGLTMMHHGFSAKDEPSSLELVIARAMRDLAMPASAKNEKNPFSANREVLAAAQAHFADHCATCHANNGSGDTEIGKSLYPKAPDMRLPQTQDLTDGELYYIIHNGVRLTGMPAWGESDQDDDSWKLVVFIRHLPQLTPEEEKEMERANPKTESERIEERQEEEFLNGGSSTGSPAKKAGR